MLNEKLSLILSASPHRPIAVLCHHRLPPLRISSANSFGVHSETERGKMAGISVFGSVKAFPRRKRMAKSYRTIYYWYPSHLAMRILNYPFVENERPVVVVVHIHTHKHTNPTFVPRFLFLLMDPPDRLISFWPMAAHHFRFRTLFGASHCLAILKLMVCAQRRARTQMPNDFKLLFHLLFILTVFRLNYLSLSTEEASVRIADAN